MAQTFRIEVEVTATDKNASSGVGKIEASLDKFSTKMTSDAVTILRDYRDNVSELRSLRRQYERLLFLGQPSELHGIASSSGSTNDATAARIQAQDGVLKRIEETELLLVAKIDAFEDVVNAIDLPRDRKLIRDYYGNGDTDQAIADREGYSRENVTRMRVEALKKIE